MNLPDDPWELLGLEKAAATERDVKRAYARLLKVHRPDSDPDGFRRVHEAYQTALGWLRDGPALTPPERPADAPVPDLVVSYPEDVREPAVPEIPPVPEGSAPRDVRDFPDVPERFLTTADNLSARMKRGPLTADSPEFTALRAMVRQDPALAAPWVALLLSLFPEDQRFRLLPLLHAEDVLLLMLHGEGEFAASILLGWREDALLLGRFNALGNLMLQRGGGAPELLQAMHFTARLSAFHLPEISSRLADELYRQTGPGLRDQIVREIEVRSAAGKLFARFALPHKRFWEHRLFEASDETVDWSTPKMQMPLRNVISGCGSEWEGWPLITQIVPEAVLREAMERVRGTQSAATVRRDNTRKFGASGGSAWAVAWILFAIIRGLFYCEKKPDSYEPPRSRATESSLPAFPSSRGERTTPRIRDPRLPPIPEFPDGDGGWPGGKPDNPDLRFPELRYDSGQKN